MMVNITPYLEDYPMTCKWLITMVGKSPKDWVVPLSNGLNGLRTGVTKYLLIGTALQV